MSEHSSQSESSTQMLWDWLLANTLGFAIATTLLFVIFYPFVALFFSGFVVGAIVGPWQAHILKGKVPGLRSWQWILASILGGYLGVLIGGNFWLGDNFLSNFLNSFISDIKTLLSIEFTDYFVEPTIFGAIVGFCVGLGQVLVLGKAVKSLCWWWVANVIGRALGWLSAVNLFSLLPETALNRSAIFPKLLAAMLCGGVGGLIYGGITAMTLPKLTSR